MNRLFLVSLFALAVYSNKVIAQTSPVADMNKQATTSATPTPTSPTTLTGHIKGEDCGCEAQVLPAVLAIVNGVKITSKEFSGQFGKRVADLQRQVIEARKRELDLQINSRLLEAEAKKRGSTTTKIIEEEVVSKVKDPTEAEAQAFYEQNKGRIRAEFKDAKNDIISYLRNEREGEEAKKLAERLHAAAQVKVLVRDVTPPASPADRGRVLATVNGQSITSSDIENSLGPLILNVQEQVYNLRRRELDLRINDTLLEQEAQKRKVTTNALLDMEVGTKIKQVTETEARAFYDQNKERLNGEFASLKEQITRYLQEREERNVQIAFAEQLRRAASIQTFLTPPKAPGSGK